MLEAYLGSVGWIKISQLQSLGISREAFYTTLILLGIIGCYFIIRPLTIIIISTQSERLLRYILSGLAFIVVFFAVVLTAGEIHQFTYQFLKLSLQVLAIFGLVLCVIHLFKTFIHKKRKA